MLVLLIVPLIGCESESIEKLNQDQSRLNLENSITVDGGPCEDLQTFTKFVNYGSYDTDFTVYGTDGTILTSEFLTPQHSSDLKSITPTAKVTVVLRNSGYALRKTVSMKTCMLYTFAIDASNTFTMYKSEL